MSSDVEWANADRANAKQWREDAVVRRPERNSEVHGSDDSRKAGPHQKCITARIEGWIGPERGLQWQSEIKSVLHLKARWRGTSRPLEWLADLDIVLVPFGDGGDVKIMKGWRDIYTTENIIEQIPSAQKKLKAVIKEYVDLYKDQNPSIICVGHSLGGSLAIVSAFDIANSGLSEINGNDHIQVCAVAFDAPRVGNQAFNDALEKLPKTKVLRINNIKDIVAYWPPCDGYVDTGKILPINSEESTFLKIERRQYQRLSVWQVSATQVGKVNGHVKVLPVTGHMKVLPVTGHVKVLPVTGHMKVLPVTGHVKVLSVTSHMKVLPVTGHVKVLPGTVHVRVLPATGHEKVLLATAHEKVLPEGRA
ncbi:hypothetical protein ZIOFF_002742 [Zingiber officinale]|uniref:Phospholipase A1 n=1 Tax=Zingiber officinale TaxID=94328 RepID=A0A8J5M9Q1_ZINOF|nr:hypothetical protein ZIOFF_002742 [Zingiber officinale]